jgi:hypothetical protein
VSRRAFVEVLSEHVVETVDRRIRCACGARRLGRVTAHREIAHRRGDVVRTPRKRAREIGAEQSAGAARPEQEADTEADGKSDRHVLNADDAHLPADRLDDVEEHEQGDGESRLARGKRDRPRRVRGEQDGKGQHRPEQRMMRSDRDDDERADDDPDCGSGQRVHDRRPGSEGVRAQHGQRAEDDPEAVL